MRRLVLTLTFTTLSTGALAEAVTTRIETRPYYGATVTIEQGVRVWRSLPPTDRIIIVPPEAKNVRVNIDAGGSNRAHATPPIVNNTVNVNGSTTGAHDVVGIPLGYGRKPHHGGGHQGRAHGHAPRHH